MSISGIKKWKKVANLPSKKPWLVSTTWLKDRLEKDPQKYQDIQPNFRKANAATPGGRIGAVLMLKQQPAWNESEAQ